MILTATFADISSGDIATTTGYTMALIKDFWPLIAILLGVGIAAAIITIFWKH